MSYLFHLPVEFYLSLRKLPDNILTKLDLHPYQIANNSFKQVSLDISSQMEVILNSEQLEEDDLIITKQVTGVFHYFNNHFGKLIDLFSDYSTIMELVLFIIGQHKETPVSSHDFDKNQINISTRADEILLDVIYQYSTISGGGPLYWIEELSMLIEQYPNYVHNNLIIFSFLLRQMSPALAVVPQQSDHFFSKFLVLVQELGSRYFTAVFLHIIGMTKSHLSHLNAALDSYERSLEISIDMGLNLQNATRNNIGIIYRNLGYLDKAEVIYRELVEKSGHYIYSGNLADTLIEKGEYDEALEILQSMDDYDAPIAIGLRREHTIHLEKENIERAKELEDTAKKVLERNDVIVNQLFLLEMQGNRHQHQGNLLLAKEIYEEKLDLLKTRSNLNGIFKTYVKLVEIQLDLLSLKPENILYKNQLYSLVNTIITLADEQGMALASIEGQMLRAEILVMDGHIDDAKEDLYNAKKLADEFDFTILYEKAEQQLNTLIEKKTTQIEEEEKGFFNRLKEATAKLLRLNTGSKYQEVESTVHGLIIIAPGGMNIFDYFPTDRLTSEPALISGLITAVSSFMSEIASGRGFLKSISHDDLDLILEPMGEFLVVCIAEEETFALRDKTRSFADDVEGVLEPDIDRVTNGEISSVMSGKLVQLAEQF